MPDSADQPERQPTSRLRLSLRTCLGLLAAAALLPALTVGAASLKTALDGQRTAFEVGLRSNARTLALALDAEIASHVSILTGLATSRRMDAEATEADIVEFSQRAKELADSLGTWLRVIGPPPEFRTLAHTGVPAGTPMGRGLRLPEADAPLPRVFATGRPAVGGFAQGSMLRRPTGAIFAPVMRNGQVIRALGMGLEPDRLSTLLTAQARGGSFATVIDSRNIIVARSRDYDRVAGQEISPWIAAGTAGQQTGLLRGTNRLEEEVIIAFHRLASAPGWMVVVGEPLAAQQEAVWRPTRALLYGGLAALGLALLTTYGIGRFILRPVRDLTRQAEAIATSGGERVGESGRPSGVAEFERLRAAAQQAHAALRARLADIALGEARLRAVLDTAADAIVVIDEAGTVLSLNRAAEAIFGYAEGEMAGQAAAALFAGDQDVLRQAGDPAGEAGGRREVVGQRRDGTLFPLELAVAAWQGADGRRGLTATMRDITARKWTEEQQRLLVREVDHRAKNALAVVQSILRLTPAGEPALFRAAVEQRVAALARTHSLLAQHGWAATELRDLLAVELSPHRPAEGLAVQFEGPSVMIAARAGQPVAILVHELATNAAKYGALSVPGGRVAVTWRIDAAAPRPSLLLRWAESGGPPAGVPSRQGFGSRVIAATARRQLGGSVAWHWEPGGLVVDIVLPLAAVLNEAEPARSPEPSGSALRS
ncbi:PAS domain S-box protein [Roseomonas sp. USHLN139]|uniref:PAS domain S-box protein n=1 Tax=Roseomonas sp. USHLN139 TaxID=3081298 RepID=UPI003B02D2F3